VATTVVTEDIDGVGPVQFLIDPDVPMVVTGVGEMAEMSYAAVRVRAAQLLAEAQADPP